MKKPSNSLEAMIAEIQGEPLADERDGHTFGAKEWSKIWKIRSQKTNHALRIFVAGGAMKKIIEVNLDVKQRRQPRTVYRDLTRKLSRPFAEIAAMPKRRTIHAKSAE